jgi:peptidoglycan/xylan/chitin deacetylase (PgdA/CDA1 family)
MKLKIKHYIKKTISKIYLPFYWLKKCFTTKQRLVILVYHSINPKYDFSIHPKKFERQIKFIKNHYDTFQLKNIFKNKGKKSKINIAISFDDGFEDNFLFAFPILKKYKIPATFFITTAFVKHNKDITKNWHCYQGLKPLKINQIKKMSQQNMDFGAHTHTHPILTNISLSEAEKEISKSKKILEKLLKKSINLFAYPKGQKNTFNEKIENILKKQGFKIACSTIWGTNNIYTNPFSLKRILVEPEDSLQDIRAKIEGKWDYINFFHMLKK